MATFNPRGLIPIRRWRDPAPVVSVLRLSGVIGQISPVRRGMTLAGLAPAIERAFKGRHLKAVALAVNSPGGSPVQSALIAGRIRALAGEKEVPVVAFTEDVAASGGYWLACAADEIFVQEASILGSIGVVSGGFGFPDLLKRLGVERRLYAAGERKGMLDAFSRERPEDVEHLRALQGEMHETFKAWVRERRAGRLKVPEETLFDGAFWSGRRAVEMGLADAVGDLRAVMRERFGKRVRLRPVAVERSWLRRRAGADGPAAWAETALAAFEERALWGRFGL